MLHAGIEALFGRNRDHHRKRSLFRLLRRHDSHKDEPDELASFFSDKAHTEKELFHGEHFAFAGMQGWRTTMEDKYKHLNSLDSRSWKFWSFYSIFDGHNGEKEKTTTTTNSIVFTLPEYVCFSSSKELIQRKMLLNI